MRKALITIQAEQLSESQISQLNDVVKRNYKQFVGDAKLQTVWARVPKGQAFTKYEDSRSSLVTMECPNGFPQNQRVDMLKACERDWLQVTKQHPDELMLALVDEDLFKTILASNQNRLSIAGRIAMALHIARAAIRSVLTGTPLSFNPNL